MPDKAAVNPFGRSIRSELIASIKLGFPALSRAVRQNARRSRRINPTWVTSPAMTK
jgi:hypothetical protein